MVERIEVGATGGVDNAVADEGGDEHLVLAAKDGVGEYFPQEKYGNDGGEGGEVGYQVSDPHAKVYR